MHHTTITHLVVSGNNNFVAEVFVM